MTGDPFEYGVELFAPVDEVDSTASTFNLTVMEVDRLIKESNLGYSEAAFRIYLFFRFVQLDIHTSILWLARSAELGNIIALGNMEKLKELSGGK
jgi:hypothetical protein